MDLRELVDAVLADLEQLALPAHQVRKYVEPRIVTPELTPLLAVYPYDSQFQHVATEQDYTATHDLRVAWVRDVTAGVETGGEGDEETATKALAEAELLLQQLKTYADGMPGLPHLYASLATATFRLVNGLIWRCEATISVDHIGY